MKVATIAEGKSVYQIIISVAAGIERKIKVRECNTAEEAKAVAQYINIRRA